MRVAIADDHRIVREGLRWMLSEDADVEIVGDASSADELLALLDEVDVDVVLLDVRMPGMSGLDALEIITRRHAEVRVLVLSMHDQESYVRRAIQLGAAGYLLKNTGRDELVHALRTVVDGGSYLHGDLVGPLIAGVASGGHKLRLSPRERQVLQLVAHGFENKQVAAELGISEATVKTHLREIFEKTGASGRAEAVAVGLREGVIE